MSFPYGEPVTAAFPTDGLGRLPHLAFRGLLGVHVSYGLPARGTAETVLCIEGFGDFVTSTAAPIATGWNDICRVGIAPTEDRTPFHGTPARPPNARWEPRPPISGTAG